MAQLFLVTFLLPTMLLRASESNPLRLKEVVAVEGVRDNQLIGYGLVVGLNGTGDKRQTVFSSQTLTNILERMGVSVPPQAILVRNMAAVMVTATLPPFAQPGTRIDVTVAAIGDASNLQGGLLLLTPLKAVDGSVFALAQGAVVTGGFVAGRGGNQQSLNHPTVGRIPYGATVEQAAPSVAPADQVRLQLKQADFSTAARIAAVVNRRFPDTPAIARAESAGTVAVKIPPAARSRTVEFLAELENLTVEMDRTSKIVINERTGTIVAGRDVRIAPVSILHGALTVEIRTQFDVSQPAPFGRGETTPIAQPEVAAREEKAKNVTLQDGATVEELAKALLQMGATARDIIAILQNLRAAGALSSEIEVI